MVFKLSYNLFLVPWLCICCPLYPYLPRAFMVCNRNTLALFVYIAESNGKLPHLLYPSKLQPWFMSLRWKTCLWAELQPWCLSLQWKTCPWAEHWWWWWYCWYKYSVMLHLYCYILFQTYYTVDKYCNTIGLLLISTLLYCTFYTSIPTSYFRHIILHFC